MLRAVRNLSLLVVVGLSVGMLGCNEAKKPGRDDQTLVTLQEQIKDLEDQLERAKAMHKGDQDELERLRQQISALQAKADSGAVAEGWHGVPGGAMIAIEGTVLFDSGRADLKSGAKQVLSQVASAIKKTYPNSEVYVFGHTDTDPIRRSKWKDNYELSCQRSLSVVRFLQSDGVGNYMAAAGWGEHRPAGDNSSKASKQANRRVEIFAMNPTAKP